MGATTEAVLRADLQDQIAMGSRKEFVSDKYIIEPAYIDFCGAAEATYANDKLAIDMFNEDETLRLFVDEEKDAACAA